VTTLTFDLARAPRGESISTRAKRLFDWLVQNSEGARCARHAALLDALNDAELAARGIRREDIIRTAFARYLHY
jgi:hypothetical protein